MATSTKPTGKLFVVSTSHMDWDWIATFEQYYNIGNPTGPTYAVRDILDTAISLMSNTAASASSGETGSPLYQYNLAELAWLQRYLQDNPGLLPTLASLEGQLFFLGGGITSPDNLMCNGEAFIRNYLVGRAYVKNIGLDGLLSDVCWIPDDFGQDPQLPVVLVAMGMKGVSFLRLPGNQPGPPDYQPVNLTPPTLPSLSEQLKTSGVTFLWQAADNSTILTQQMSSGYGVIWDQSGALASSLSEFLRATGVLQPGNLFLAPCGGDFSMPSRDLIQAVCSYNKNPVNGICAELRTFEDFIDAMNQYETDNPGTLKTWKSFDASNYWTGCFAGRVALKIRQQRTVNHLLAAETLSTLLRGQANLSGTVLDAIDCAIDAAWENLVPSTHHDYVVGTAPDQTYWMEQEPLSALALAQSSAALAEAMSRLGHAVKPAAQTDEIPYVAFNPSGFARQVGTVVEIPRSRTSKRSPPSACPEAPLRLSRRCGTGTFCCPIRSSAAPATAASICPKPPLCPRRRSPAPSEATASSFTFGNGIVQITVAQASGWAITSIKDLQNGGAELLTAGAVNQIAVYYEPCAGNGDLCQDNPAAGNLYQMGNELGPKYAANGGFYTDDTGVFAGGVGSMAESGPYRQHFVGRIHNETNNLAVTVEYLLETGEPLVRMRVTGQAASTATSIVTSWTLRDGNGNPPSGISYGTPNHWNGPGYTAYWYGPTFRATHDFVLLEQGNETGNPLAAIYHEGMRAWAFDGQTLMGVLFRNAPGRMRGAAGTDTSVHVQHYAFRLPGVAGAVTCQPLQESLAFQLRQPAAPVVVPETPLSLLPETGMLAAMEEPNAIVRMARSQPGSGGTSTDTGTRGGPCPFSFVLRIYQPTNSAADAFHVKVPFLASVDSPKPAVSLVTALEEEMNVASPPYSNGIVEIQSMPTLTTLRIQSYGTNVMPTNGK
jgi:alpha-mannosidase